MLLATYVLVAYLLGSLSAALLVCKLFALPDPRLAGSCNPGATNVLRLGGKFPGFLTLAGDALKGFAPVFIASLQPELEPFLGWIALSAFLGHLYPIYFKFRGGKGVATYLGCLCALDWRLGVAFVSAWLLVALVTRYSSLAALVASVCLPFVAAQWAPLSIGPLCLMVVAILWRHRSNIQKLLKGEESKIGKTPKVKL